MSTLSTPGSPSSPSQHRRASTSSLTTPSPPPPAVASLLSRQPFRARSARRDLSTSFSAFRAAWEALTRAVVLQDAARRLGKRAGELLSGVEARLKAVEEADQSRMGSKVYEFQGGAGAETVFRLQALLLDIKAFAIDFASPSDRLSLLVTGLLAQQRALAGFTKSIQTTAALYSVPLSTADWPEQDTEDQMGDLALLPRLFQVSVALRGPTYKAFVDATGTSASDQPGKRRAAFVEWCLEKNSQLRATEAAEREDKEARSPQRFTTIGALQTTTLAPVTTDATPTSTVVAPMVQPEPESLTLGTSLTSPEEVAAALPAPPATSALAGSPRLTSAPLDTLKLSPAIALAKRVPAPTPVPTSPATPSSTRRASSSSVHSLISVFGTPTQAALKPKPGAPAAQPQAEATAAGRPRSAPQLTRAPSLPPPTGALPPVPRAKARRAVSERIDRSPTGDLQLWSSFPAPPPRESPPAAEEVEKRLPEVEPAPVQAKESKVNTEAGQVEEATSTAAAKADEEIPVQVDEAKVELDAEQDKQATGAVAAEADEELVDEYMARRRQLSASSAGMSKSGSVDSHMTAESSLFDHLVVGTIEEDVASEVPQDEEGAAPVLQEEVEQVAIEPEAVVKAAAPLKHSEPAQLSPTFAASVPLPPSLPETEVEPAYSSIFSAFDSPTLLTSVSYGLSPPTTPAPAPAPASPANATASTSTLNSAAAAVPAHMKIPQLTFRPATPLTGESTPVSAIQQFSRSLETSKPLPPVPGQQPPRALRVLALDGGGIRGLALLHQVQAILPAGQRACEAFDLIAGVGTGGLVAVLLGRMRLDCQTALSIYTEVARQAFVAKDVAASGAGARRGRWSKLFGRGATSPPGEAAGGGREVRLDKALRAFLPDYPLLDRKAVADGPGVGCQTAVLAFPSGGKAPAEWITSWQSGGHDGLSVCEALKATVSASSFFRPFRVDGTPGSNGRATSRVFGAAPATLNLPEAAFALASGALGADGRGVGVVSVGVGRVSPGLKLPSKTKMRILKAVAQLGDAAASAAERARLRVEKAGGSFARLDVGGGEADRGVEEWEGNARGMEGAVQRGVLLSGQLSKVEAVLKGERAEAKPAAAGVKGGRVAELKRTELGAERTGRVRRSTSLTGLRDDFRDALFYLQHTAAGSTGSLNLHFE